MWSDFQSAAAVRVAETLRAPSPMDVRCWLISVSAAEVRSGRRVPQSAPGAQLLSTAREGAATAGPPALRTAAHAAAAIAALTSFLPMEPPEVSDSTG